MHAELLDVLPGQSFKQKTKMAEAACHEPRVNATLINNDGMRVFGLLANPGPNDPVIVLTSPLKQVAELTCPGICIRYLDPSKYGTGQARDSATTTGSV